MLTGVAGEQPVGVMSGMVIGQVATALVPGIKVKATGAPDQSRAIREPD